MALMEWQKAHAYCHCAICEERMWVVMMQGPLGSPCESQALPYITGDQIALHRYDDSFKVPKEQEKGTEAILPRSNIKIRQLDASTNYACPQKDTSPPLIFHSPKSISCYNCVCRTLWA